MLRLLGSASSINVRKVLWTCDELGLDCRRDDCADTREWNPNGLVPVLIDEGGALWESNTICRYLAADSPLLPSASRARAAVEQWMDWQATDLNSAWRDAFMGLVRADPRFADPARIAAGVVGWNAAMAVLEGRLAQTGAFVTGADFTLADIVLGLSVNRWRMTPMERPGTPAIDAYEARLRLRPGYLAHGANGVP